MRKTILIIEEDKSLSNILTYGIMEFSENYTVIQAFTKSQVESCFESYKIDLVIADVTFMSDDEVSFIAGVSKFDQNTKLLIYSSKKDFKQIGQKIGADYSIRMPFDMETILEKIC